MADRPTPEPDPGTPSWVKLGGVAAAILAVLTVVAHLALNNLPGHTASSALDGHLSSSSVTDRGAHR